VHLVHGSRVHPPSNRMSGCCSKDLKLGLSLSLDQLRHNFKFERMIIDTYKFGELVEQHGNNTTFHSIPFPLKLKGKTSTWEVGALECKEKRPKKFSEKHREWLQ